MRVRLEQVTVVARGGDRIGRVFSTVASGATQKRQFITEGAYD